MRKSQHSSRLIAHKGMPLILAGSWISGLLCGVFCYSVSSPEIIALMHRTPSCSVSIVGLLNAALIPFLLSAFFLAYSLPWIVTVICFWKAFLFSFVSAGFLTCFGSGGWLLRYILLFSDCTALPLLYWYWFRGVSTPSRLCRFTASAILFCVFVFVAVLDYHIFAPIVCLIDSMKG